MAVGDGSAVSDVIASALPGILDRARVVISPYPFGVGADDNLRVISFNAAAGVSIEVHGRLVGGGVEPSPFRFVHAPNSDRTVKVDDYKLGPGIVTNLSVFAAAGTPMFNQTFVIVQLIKSLGAVAYVMGTLLAGPVTATQAMGWPGSPIQNSVDGNGYIRAITGTQPAAFGELNETAPTGARWELLSVSFTLATSAAAGTRLPQFRIAPAGQVAFNLADTNGVGPSVTQRFTYAQSVAFFLGSTVNSYTYPLPAGIIIPAGGAFQTLTQGLQLADQYSAPSYVVREWLEGQ